ncbi:uncharacterized protein DS421_1g15430 [Arachis hypogaea]|nr:uncharacterized protein DS421_1g15430 [Arachis hypogaea]
MEEAEIGTDEAIIIIMKHQGPEFHLGEQAKDGALGLMKSDDQGRTRGICMLGFAWVTSSLSLWPNRLCMKEKKLSLVFVSTVKASLLYKRGEQSRLDLRS